MSTSANDPVNDKLEADTDYLFCPVCKTHVPCRRVPSGGWEVQCSGCTGECAMCSCWLQRFCFGSRDQFPPLKPGSEGRVWPLKPNNPQS